VSGHKGLDLFREKFEEDNEQMWQPHCSAMQQPTFAQVRKKTFIRSAKLFGMLDITVF
jgi:hypothetical protein